MFPVHTLAVVISVESKQRTGGRADVRHGTAVTGIHVERRHQSGSSCDAVHTLIDAPVLGTHVN